MKACGPYDLLQWENSQFELENFAIPAYSIIVVGVSETLLGEFVQPRLELDLALAPGVMLPGGQSYFKHNELFF